MTVLRRPSIDDECPYVTPEMSDWEAQEIRTAWRNAMAATVESAEWAERLHADLGGGASWTFQDRPPQGVVDATLAVARLFALISGSKHRQALDEKRRAAEEGS